MAIFEPFDQLLKEKVEELNDYEAREEQLQSDPVELLKVAALRSLLNGNVRAVPWRGAGSYNAGDSDKMTDSSHKLDVLF